MHQMTRKIDDYAQGVTSERWQIDRVYVSRKEEGRGHANIEDWGMLLYKNSRTSLKRAKKG